MTRHIRHTRYIRPVRPTDTAELAGSLGIGAWAAFAVVSFVVGGRGRPLSVDEDLLSWSLGHRPEVAVAAARGLTATGTGVVPYVLVVLAGIAFGGTARRRTVAAALGVACLALGQAVRHGVMELVARPRPPRPDWEAYASGWAFPSGHTTTSALTAGLLILAIVVRAPRGRTALCLVAGCWGVLVGLTRVYLGVHWFTDVLGGWLFAAGWLGMWLCAAARWLPARVRTDVRTPPGGSPERPTPPEPPGGPGRSGSG
ncbi:phosphatase PAP2 family protein [Streptomyces sp. NPDC006393]|uniref:phosphatase PAP2 family protein n=1 Tax=Streptomyces sp. NPDC006393 TaxID=3156763 RepID=UPI0033CA9339